MPASSSSRARRPKRPNGNVAAARAVLIGVHDFLHDHPANMALFSQYVQEQEDSDRIRSTMSVPLLEDTAEDLFVAHRNPKTRLQKAAMGAVNLQTKHRIRRDVKQAHKDPVWHNHRAAVEVVKQLPKAALVQDNQVLMLALGRYLATPSGSTLNDAIGGLNEIQELLEQYEELQRERELLALGKIAEAHLSLQTQAIEGQNLAEVIDQVPAVVIAPEVEREHEVARKVEPVIDLTEPIEPIENDWWTIDGEKLVLPRSPIEKSKRHREKIGATAALQETSQFDGRPSWSEARADALLNREAASKPDRATPPSPNRKPRTPSQRGRDNEPGLGRGIGR